MRDATFFKPFALLAACVPLAVAAQDGASCSARSAASAARVVELYTSEGCNSCPPADRWLGTLKGRADVVALAFHVDYWDRLGWTDRFASPAWTQRQREASARSGARFVYTPQVLLDGRDYRGWPKLPERTSSAPVELSLSRDGSAYLLRWKPLGDPLTVPTTAAKTPLAGYWAVTEDGHRTQVRAGENAGVTLLHDGVVREFVPVERLGAESPLRFTPRETDDHAKGAVARRVHFIAIDSASGLPVQAVSLGC